MIVQAQPAASGMRRARLLILLALAGLVLAASVVAVRWWRGPTPEREAERYFEKHTVASPGTVHVLDCGRSRDPEMSQQNRFWCVIEARRVVPRGFQGAADVRRGTTIYCFLIPRSGPVGDRADRDAFPLYPVLRRNCF
jgi:hypothetical protein